MRIQYGICLISLLAVVSVITLPRLAEANPCVSPNPSRPFSQGFPATGGEVTRWRGTVCSVGEFGLVLGPTFFRKSLGSNFVQIFHEARVSEIFVHYHSGTSFFDISDFSSGLMTLGPEECPSSMGTLILSGRACMEVRDRGIAFKTDSAARRGEDLVLWGIIRSANYKYLMEWTLRDDGVIVGRVGATGVNLAGMHMVPHIHTITWRLDIDLNGAAGDSVREVTHIESLTNNTATDSVTQITTEGGRTWSPAGFRYWLIRDATLENAQGNRTGLRLIPVRTGTSRHDVPYTMSDFWVTRFPGSKTAEMFAADLPEYVSDLRSVSGQDIIVWYTGGIHHVPRDEDDSGATQLMTESFMLVPENLFDASPIP